MRSVIWLVLLFTAAVVAATALGRNDALVSVFYGEWRVDLSLNLFLLVLLAGIFIVFTGMQAMQSLLSLPTRAREWREQKRERGAGEALREALAELFAARYARAQRAAQRALDLQASCEALRGDVQFTVLAQMIAASGAAAPVRPARGAGVDAWMGWGQRLWQQAVAETWAEIRTLVRVTHIERPEAMLIAPEQAYYLRENLKLRVLNARLSLLSRQFDQAQTDLALAQSVLDRYFDGKSRRVALTQDLLRQVAAQARQANLPRPDETLAALAAASAGR